MKNSGMAMVLWAGLVAAGASAQEGFFKPGPVAPQLPEGGIFPQGRVMHIGGYSAVSAPVKQLNNVVPLDVVAKSGFTVAGPYYGAFDGFKGHVEYAAKLGMRVAAQLQVPPVLNFQKGEDALKLRGARMAALPEDELRKHVQQNMNNVLQNPELNRAVSCWAIAPEELRFWIKPELDYQRAFANAVHDFDPQKRPVFMYEPNHRNTDALLKTGTGQDFVLMGAYVHNLGWDVQRALRINWAMDQMTGAAAQDKRTVVPGLELSRDMPGFTAKDLEAEPALRGKLKRLLRHDVYLCLARGAQGFQVWSLYHSRPAMTTYAELLEGYGEVFRELSQAPLKLQEPFLFGERRGDVKLEFLAGPQFISAPPKAGTLEAVEGKIDVQAERWPSVRLANIAYGDARVLLLVNSSAEATRVKLSGIPATAKVNILSGGDAAKIEAKNGNYEAALEPFAALVLRVTRD